MQMNIAMKHTHEQTHTYKNARRSTCTCMHTIHYNIISSLPYVQCAQTNTKICVLEQKKPWIQKHTIINAHKLA